MDLGDLLACIVPSLDGPVLEVLARTEKPMTGRQVQRVARRGSVAGVANVLDRLVEHGLVLRADAGSAALYQVNRRHLAWPAVRLLVDLRGALIARLIEAVEGLRPVPEEAILFGSLARGEGTAASDIDVLLVHAEDSEPWGGQLADLAEQIHQASGNHLHWVTTPAARWAQMTDEGDPLVDSVGRDGVALLGSG